MKEILEQLSKYDLTTLTELFEPRYVDVLLLACESLKYRQDELLKTFVIHRNEISGLQQRIKEIHKPTENRQDRLNTSMKFSDTTLKILKVFSSFSNQMVFKPGQLQTISRPHSAFYAWAILEESFPCEAVIYNLKDFLYRYSQHDNPSIDFFDDHYTCYGSDDVTNDYVYGSKTFFVEPTPLPLIERENNIATFMLEKESIKKINSARNKAVEADYKSTIPSWKFSTNNEKVFYSSSFGYRCGFRNDENLFTFVVSEFVNGKFNFIVYDQEKPKKILDGDYDCYVYDFGNTDEYRHNQPTGWLEMYNTTLNLTYLLPIDFLV